MTLALSPWATAQQPRLLYEIRGTTPGAHFGYAVESAGDVDGDGTPDLIIGADEDPVFGARTGSAQVHSGRTGVLLFRLEGSQAEDRFGAHVAGLGDVDGDGRSDVAVGALQRLHGATMNARPGYARVYSGADGSQLHEWGGSMPADAFAVVGRVGDVNNDGFADIGVGVPGDDCGGSNTGSARVFSGKDGSTLWAFKGTAQTLALGQVVRGDLDFNLDGFSDVLVSGDEVQTAGGFVERTGSIRCFSGSSGALLWESQGGFQAHDLFGFPFSVGEDATGDGLPDIVAGASMSSVGALFGGEIRLVSSHFGISINQHKGTQVLQRLGEAVAGPADLNGDGIYEWVGHWRNGIAGPSAGTVRVVQDDQAATTLHELHGTASGAQFGASLAIPGDLNGDGLAELVVGIPGRDRVQVWTFRPIEVRLRCVGKRNSQGCLPAMTYGGSPSLSGTSGFRLGARNILTSKPGLLFYGFASASIPFQGGTLCVQPPIQRTGIQGSGGPFSPETCDGEFDFDFQSWANSGVDPSLAPGVGVHAQWWYRDPNSPSTTGLSDSAQFTLEP